MDSPYTSLGSKKSGSSNKSICLIGIGGATRCGKGTLATNLAKTLGLDPLTQIVSADRCFKRHKPWNDKLHCIDWEQPDAIDWNRLEGAIETARRTIEREGRPKYLIVEGFLLFSYKPLQKLFDFRLFLSISKKTCFVRRQTSKRVSLEYFNGLLWPSYVKYNRHLLDDEDIVILNGESPSEDLLQQALKVLKGEKILSEPQLFKDAISDEREMTRKDLDALKNIPSDPTKGYREGMEYRAAKYQKTQEEYKNQDRKRKYEENEGDNEDSKRIRSTTDPKTDTITVIGLGKEKWMEKDPAIEKVLSLISKVDANSQPLVVLVSTGAFAPIHLMHLELFEAAKKYLTAKLSYRVVAGIISPSSDSYVGRKMKQHKEDLDSFWWMKADHRLAMCEAAVASSDWLFVSNWECTQAKDAKFSDVVHYVERAIHDRVIGHRVRVMYLCGVDHILKRVSLWDLKRNGVIVVGRTGYSNTETSKELERFNKESDQWVHFITDKLSDISSTAVRELLRKKVLPTEMLPDGVLKYLSDNSKDLLTTSNK